MDVYDIEDALRLISFAFLFVACLFVIVVFVGLLCGCKLFWAWTAAAISLGVAILCFIVECFIDSL